MAAFPEEELQEIAARMEDVLIPIARGDKASLIASEALKYVEEHMDRDKRVILDMADLISALAERLWDYEPGFEWQKLLEDYQSKQSGVTA